MFERRVSATRSLRQVESGRHTKTHERNLLGRNNLSLVQFFSPLRLNIRHTNSLFSALFVLDDRHRVSIGFSRSLSRSTEVCVTTKVTSKANGKRDTHAVRPYESLSLSLSLSRSWRIYIRESTIYMHNRAERKLRRNTGTCACLVQLRLSVCYDR